MNFVILLGNLGNNPELKYTPSGSPVATFSIATNESYKDKEGKLVEKAEWHRIVCWNKTAEIAAKYLHKGDKVLVQGKIQTRSWDAQDGKRYITEIVASRIEFTGSKKQDASEPAESDEPHVFDIPTTQPQKSNDDLPF